MKLLMILLIVIVVLVLLWLWRNKADRLGRSFIESVRQMEKECSIEGRYQVPWLLLLGDDQKNSESLCRAWQLKTAEKAAWFGRFCYSSDAVVLLPPHDMYQQAEGALAVLSTWRRLLASLLRVRGQRPIDAVIWAVSAERLLRKDAVLDVAQCKQFQDAQQRLGQTLPVYWLITGLQDLNGVNELIESLPDQAQEGVLGWSSVLPLSAAYQRDHLDSAIGQIQRQLSDCIAEIATLNGGVSDSLYLLPRQLDVLRLPLHTLGEAAFQTNAMGDAPVLRGVYFVASYAHPQSETDVFAPQPEPLPDTPVFAARLLRQRIAAERGLAQPIVRILALRQRWYRLARLIAVIFCSLWLLAMVWVWQQARQDAIVLNRALSALGNESSQTESDLGGQSAVALWRALFAVPRLDFENAVFPGSLLSNFDQSLAEKVAGFLQTEWFLPVYGQLQADLKTMQLEGESIEKKSRDEAASPETWPRYLSAQRLVQQAKALEQNMASYHRALRGGADALAQLSELSNRLWDSDFRPERLPLRNRLEVILSQYALWMGRPLKLEEATQEAQQHFLELMQGWLNRLYADATFIETADSVQQELSALQGGERNNYAELKHLNEQISLLRQLIAATNVAWSSASGQDLVPGYSDMLNQARTSRFIGKELVQKIEAHSAMLRKAFKERWSNRESSLTARGEVGLKEDVLQLQAAITYLLQQSFVVKAHTAGTQAVAGSLKEMSEARLVEALSIYQERQRYQTQTLAKVPDAYRLGLSSFASKSAANAMWFMMGGHAVDDLGQRNAVDSVDGLIRAAPEIKAALLDLGRTDLANEFVREMNERALAVLRQADSQQVEMAPYQPKQATFSWWDGKKNASFKAFKVNNSLELQQYLKRQLEQISALSAKQESVLDWLNAHQKSMGSKDLQAFARWRVVAAELKKFKEKAPDSGPAFLTQIISKDLNEMDVSSCHSVLQQLELPAGSSLFAERAQRLVQMANDRCSGLRSQSSAYAWQQLSAYFNLYVAGRFPFAANANAPDAEIERVTTLLRLIDTHLPAAEAGLDESDSVHKEAAKLYLQGLQYTRELLGPILLRGTVEQPQPAGLDLDVQWRSDKDKEQGADQVIEWGLTVGTQRQRYPQGERGKLRWLVGQPLNFSLRWAADSAQRPLEEISQPALMVFEQGAEWRYTGSWSLLRFLRNHRAPPGMVLQEEYSYPALLFSLPIGGQAKDKPRAQMFARFGISAVGAKALLPVQLLNALPLKAPASPFRQIVLPDSDKLLGAP
ncbi:type VI secretion system protein [Iodobacter arcticus]|uniref:Type VI secretion system protein n=1 Tax=Iodobacter arcticus TaxID=590593 RepID=A0ABW2R4Z4_9NEIS